VAVTELDWHIDGHVISLTLDKSEVKVSSNVCPHGAVSTAECFHVGIQGCIVSYFVTVYELDTNQGTCPAAANIEIAWASSGSKWDIDSTEFHMIPVSDPVFSDWKNSLLSSK